MTTTRTAPAARTDDVRLRLGASIMAVAGLGFVGYGVLFFVRNFTDSFLELGIGREQVDVGRSEIDQFSPDLLH